MSGGKAEPNFAPGDRVFVVVGTRQRGPRLVSGEVAEVFPLAITVFLDGVPGPPRAFLRSDVRREDEQKALAMRAAA